MWRSVVRDTKKVFLAFDVMYRNYWFQFYLISWYLRTLLSLMNLNYEIIESYPDPEQTIISPFETMYFHICFILWFLWFLIIFTFNICFRVPLFLSRFGVIDSKFEYLPEPFPENTFSSGCTQDLLIRWLDMIQFPIHPTLSIDSFEFENMRADDLVELKGHVLMLFPYLVRCHICMLKIIKYILLKYYLILQVVEI